MALAVILITHLALVFVRMKLLTTDALKFSKFQLEA